MGIIDTIKKRVNGGNEEDGFDTNYTDDGYYGDNFGVYDDVPAGDAAGADPDAGYAPMGGQGISLAGSGGSALEMKVVKPETFDSVAQIADHLLSRRTVVLNVENTNKETCRRIIDFLSGVAYSIDGSLKKIATNAYVITPSNVDVGDAKLSSHQAAEQPAPKEEVPQNDGGFGDY